MRDIAPDLINNYGGNDKQWLQALSVWYNRAEAGELRTPISAACAALQDSTDRLPRAAPRTLGGPAGKMANSMEERRPFIFTHPSSGRSAVLCFCQKVGSMAWTSLLAKPRSTSALRWAHRRNYIDFPSPNRSLGESSSFLAAHGADVLDDPAVPRIRIVRNPYSRLLSGFLDKLTVTNQTHAKDLWLMKIMKPRGFRLGGSFEHFVRALIKMPSDDRGVNGHFRLQHDACQLPGGRSWDYELKSEEMATWYAPVIRLLGLEADACQGWEHTLAQPCFWHPRGRDCAWESTVASWRQGSSWMRVRHNQYADSKLTRYLTNATLAEAITRWVHRDLKRFGYPEYVPR